LSFYMATTQQLRARGGAKEVTLWKVLRNPASWGQYGYRIWIQLLTEFQVSSEVGAAPPHPTARRIAVSLAPAYRFSCLSPSCAWVLCEQNSMWSTVWAKENNEFDEVMQDASKSAALVEGWRVDPSTDKRLWTEFTRVLRGLSIVPGAGEKRARCVRA
jgi:hypothetical protein